MKSETAKEILNDGSCHVSDGELLDGHRVGCAELVYYSDTVGAIEAAEREAEERMREKTTKAFCHNCPIYSVQTSNGGGIVLIAAH